MAMPTPADLREPWLKQITSETDGVKWRPLLGLIRHIVEKEERGDARRKPAVRHITWETDGGKWRPLLGQVRRMVEEDEGCDARCASDSRRRYAADELRLLYLRFGPAAEEVEEGEELWEELKQAVGKTLEQLRKFLSILGRLLCSGRHDERPYPFSGDVYADDKCSVISSAGS